MLQFGQTLEAKIASHTETPSDIGLETPQGYHKNPQRAAWIVLIIGFITFCAIISLIGWGGYWYVTQTKDHFTTTVTSIGGTVLAKANGAELPIPILQNAQLMVEAATIISTDNASQAALTFFNDSAITLYSNTTLIIQQSHRPRFGWSSDSELIEIEIVQGRIRAAPVEGDTSQLFVIQTPHATANLREGSYAVEVNNQQTQVTTRLGSAEVIGLDKTVRLREGLRCVINQGEPPSEAIAAEQNLIINGDFSQGLSAESWQRDIFIPENSVSIITTTVQLETVEGRRVAHFRSQGEDNIHTEAALEQIINKDMRDFRSLRINADIFLAEQSLPGGGQLGSEFPIFIRLSYKDNEGNDREWYHGFYYEPPSANDHFILHNRPDNASENISKNLWYPYESENLLETLGDIKPVFVKSLRIYASGWIYEAMITDIKLLAQD